MNYFVLATHAVTVDGEWVTPESVQQVDFDSLLCIYCKLQIGVQFNPLTSTKRLCTYRGISTMLLGLKHVDLTSSKQYQNKPRQNYPASRNAPSTY